MSTEQNKALAGALIKPISVGDSEVIRKLVSEDCKCWITGFPRDRPFSRNQMMSGARTIIDQFLPGGFNLKIEGMTAEGDRVAVEAQSHNHTVSGKLYNNFYHFLFEFRDGKVIRWMEYTNPMHALEVFGDVVGNSVGNDSIPLPRRLGSCPLLNRERIPAEEIKRSFRYCERSSGAVEGCGVRASLNP